MPRLKNQAAIEAAIRADYAAGGISQRALARKHKVSLGFVCTVLAKAPATAPPAPARPAPKADATPPPENLVVREAPPTRAAPETPPESPLERVTRWWRV